MERFDAHLSPGPELDAMVSLARKDYFEKTGHIDESSYYSTSISDAWELVEELRVRTEERTVYFDLNEYTDGWIAEFQVYSEHSKACIPDNRHGSPFCNTAPHAICLAYLEVKNDRG